MECALAAAYASKDSQSISDFLTKEFWGSASGALDWFAEVGRFKMCRPAEQQALKNLLEAVPKSYWAILLACLQAGGNKSSSYWARQLK